MLFSTKNTEHLILFNYCLFTNTTPNYYKSVSDKECIFRQVIIWGTLLSVPLQSFTGAHPSVNIMLTSQRRVITVQSQQQAKWHMAQDRRYEKYYSEHNPCSAAYQT